MRAALRDGRAETEGARRCGREGYGGPHARRRAKETGRGHARTRENGARAAPPTRFSSRACVLGCAHAVCARARMCKRACVRACARRACVCACMCVHVCAFACAFAWARACARVCMCVHVHVHLHGYVRARVWNNELTAQAGRRVGRRPQGTPWG